jgi:mannose-6-phosphate isomerase-like protein (cupin superfamily)
MSNHTLPIAWPVVAILLAFIAGACGTTGQERTDDVNARSTVPRADRAVPEQGAPSHPSESYVRPPEVTPSPDDFVFGRDHMVHFYDVPGEYGWVVEGRDHGFSDLSFITTETWPGGGPPLHTHETEEAHVLQRGSYRVLIGERRFDVTGPAAVRIPAGVPHTFMNTGDDIIHVVGILPGDSLTYEELGPNPLLSEAGEADASRESGRDS